MPKSKNALGRFAAYRVALFNLSVCECVCVKFVVLLVARAVRGRFSQNPGSMEAGEYGLTRGLCFLECRLELDAVAGLLWISWCDMGEAEFFRAFHEFTFSNLFVDPRQPASNR